MKEVIKLKVWDTPRLTELKALKTEMHVFADGGDLYLEENLPDTESGSCDGPHGH